MAGGTILKLGYSDPLTDTFGAHPLLGSVIDLNDGVTFTLVSPGGLEMPTPPRTLVLAGNIRSQGEVATRAITRHNRTVTARLLVGPSASSSALLSAIRNLLTWLAAPPQVPITLQYQPFNGSAPVYLDVVGAAHNLPSDEGQWLRGQFEPLTLTFTCRPGMRGDRITLQNLVANPGFEQPSSGGITVFDDSFATTNAYTTVVGGAPSVAAHVLTVPANSQITFGSPAWGALQRWQIRWQAQANQVVNFCLHVTDANNLLFVEISTGAGVLQIYHTIAGTAHLLASTTVAYTAGSWYWLAMTQFPSVTNNPPDVQAALYTDSAGSVGAQVAAVGPIPAFNAITALNGHMAIQTGSASVAVGGAFSGVQTVSLFGPGGWLGQTVDAGSVGATGVCAAAWDGSVAGAPGSSNGNTYPNGPVSSFGAARLDLPRAGTVSAAWVSYGGGPPTGTSAMAVGPGNTLSAAAQVRSSGLSAGAVLYLIANEFDASGAFLRFSVLRQQSGNQGSWTTVSGSWTTGANCAYVGLVLRVDDTSAPGASANGTVWCDNVQCWNQTTTGQTSMPYCELRASKSPAQLVVSGLLGDLPAPCFLAAGAFVSSLPAGGALTLYIGRKGITSPNAQLVGQSYGAFAASFSPQSFAELDGGSYGGFNGYASVGAGGWNPRAFSQTAADAPGVYHLLARVRSEQTAGNLSKISLRVSALEQTDPWINQQNGSDLVGGWDGPYTYPFTTQSAWTVADAGQFMLPPFPLGALNNPAARYWTPRAQWQDTSGAPAATGRANWQALLPVDGSLLVATVNNPTNGAGTITNLWLWTYADGLLLNRAGANDGPAWTYSLEGTPIPNPANGAGGAGTSGSGAINVNSGADPALVLDPTQAGANGSKGVNQLLAVVTDQVGSMLPFAGEIRYSPLYLEPR